MRESLKSVKIKRSIDKKELTRGPHNPTQLKRAGLIGEPWCCQMVDKIMLTAHKTKVSTVPTRVQTKKFSTDSSTLKPCMNVRTQARIRQLIVEVR